MNINLNLSAFPQPKDLLKRLVFYSIMDAIMNADTEDDASVYRCHTDWNAGVALFTIDDGGGDHFHILFSENGCLVKGFGHESALSPYNYEEGEYPDYRLYANAPPEFLEYLDDEALEKDLVTFCAWHTGNGWQAQKLNVPNDWDDGSDDFLEYVSALDEYIPWLNAYYEKDFAAETVTELYNGGALNEETVAALNPDADVDAVMFAIGEIKRAAVV